MTTKAVKTWFRSRITARGLTITAIACSIGCAAEPLGVREALETVGCDGPGCDVNSPIIAGVQFYELDSFGTPNDQGLRISDVLSPSGVSIPRIEVRQGLPVGVDRSGNIVLNTGAMVGSIIKVTDDKHRTWDIKLNDDSDIPFWAFPWAYAITFELLVRGPLACPRGVDWCPLCPVKPAPSDWPGGNVLHAIFFEGDRYNYIDKTVWAIGAGTTGWFNIACAGSTPAKLYLARHSESSAAPSKSTTQPERQALLKAYTASMCPGSWSFTGVGEPLHVATSNDLMPETARYSSFEGLWNENGVVCTGEHRLLDPKSMNSDEAKALMSQIVPQCGLLPTCTKADIENWKDHGFVLTHNP
jgi:hypothetical protein